MEMIKYERFEDWLSLLKAGDKTTIIYIDVIRIKPTENTISMNILFQLTRGDYIHSFLYTEGMPMAPLISERVFDVLSNEKLRNEAIDDYHHTLDLYDQQVLEEYKKAEDVIKSMGYTNIVMGLIQ